MEIILFLGLFLLLAVIAFQDFRFREIDWFLPLLLLFVSVCIHWHFQKRFCWEFILFNCSFLLVQWAALTIYFSLKLRKWVNITNNQLGLGDMLFAIPLCFLFAPITFVLFFIITLIFTLLSTLIFSFFIKNTNNSIPLAGCFSIALAIHISIAYLLHWPLYDNSFWIDYGY